jgi:hypothetical protein
MPGAQCTRSLVCEVVVQDAHEYSQRSHRKSPGIPARNGFTAYVVLSPAIGLSCHRRLRKSLSANLTPASRRQDHTILPSASKALSSEALPAATASSPASVTIAIRPSSGVDGCGYKLICDFGKPEYFFRRDWTGQITLIGLRKLDFTRNPQGRAGKIRSPDQASGSGRHDAREAEHPAGCLRRPDRAIECTVNAMPRPPQSHRLCGARTAYQRC